MELPYLIICILADYQRGPEFEALFSLIPAAFFKSIGYGAVATLLGGGLTGFTLADESWQRWLAARHGGMVLAINIASVVPEDLFRAETDRLARNVQTHYRPMPGRPALSKRSFSPNIGPKAFAMAKWNRGTSRQPVNGWADAQQEQYTGCATCS